MEKNDNWNVGDILLCKNTGARFEIIRIACDGNYQQVLVENIEKHERMVDPLMFMSKYWINLGNSKYWKVLYGTKGKNSTDKLSDKG